MRISDWSSDVCSSDLSPPAFDPANSQFLRLWKGMHKRNYAKRRIMRRCRRRVQLLHQTRRRKLHIITTTAGSSSDCRRLGSAPARRRLVADSSAPVPSSPDTLRRTYTSFPFPPDPAKNGKESGQERGLQ